MGNFKSLDRFTRLAFFVIIAGILLRFVLAIPYHVAGDACWHISNARFMADSLSIPFLEPLGRDQPFWPPPLFHIVIAIFFKIFGIFGTEIANFGLKLVSPIVSSFLLVVSYLMFRELFSKKIAFYGTVFMTFIPISIDYGVFAYADGLLTLLILASIYFALKNRVWIASFSLGLAMLTKYTSMFAIPALIYILYTKNRKSFIKNFSIFALTTAAISLPWYIRNWIYLKNPVYPILNSLFGGIEIGATYSGFEISKLLSFNSILFPFFELFGAPDGNVTIAFIFNSPYILPLVSIWIVAIIIFSIPVFFGRLSRESRNVSLFLAVPFMLAAVLHIMNVGWSTGRRLMPIIIVLAFLWANGIENLNKRLKNPKHSGLMFLIIIVIISGLVISEAAKIGIASNSWNSYNEDFRWARENTPKDALFVAGGQCLSYNLERFAYQPFPDNMQDVDYIWFNQNFWLDGKSILDSKQLESFNELDTELVYENKATHTRIYKIIP
jgi:4-amino-4-deoxy-L-arabinose transferase-like glycosyltransferase